MSYKVVAAAVSAAPYDISSYTTTTIDNVDLSCDNAYGNSMTFYLMGSIILLLLKFL